MKTQQEAIRQLSKVVRDEAAKWGLRAVETVCDAIDVSSDRDAYRFRLIAMVEGYLELEVVEAAREPASLAFAENEVREEVARVACAIIASLGKR